MASALAVLLAAVVLAATVTDMPGYYYPPRLFALANVVVVPLLGVALRIRAARQLG